MNSVWRLLAIISIAFFSVAASGESSEVAHFTSGNRQVTYDIYGSGSQGPILIMLHGASGPDVPFYRGLAQNFAAKNYVVFFLHYFDASDTRGGSAENYAAWEKAVGDLVMACKNDPK